MENMLALSNQSISDAYTQYARSIFLYIYYKVEDEELAHDLVQDTFLRLISYRGKICFHTVYASAFSAYNGWEKPPQSTEANMAEKSILFDENLKTSSFICSHFKLTILFIISL
jgi:hypothetical protein